MFRVKQIGTNRFVAKCGECGHVQPVKNGQVRGDDVIVCENCGNEGYAE